MEAPVLTRIRKYGFFAVRALTLFVILTFIYVTVVVLHNCFTDKPEDLIVVYLWLPVYLTIAVSIIVALYPKGRNQWFSDPEKNSVLK
ncbi:hypothetical protein A2533_04450 [Candidatus Falkowbacteria bacterium RIFOXYD2_FULL_35_9]|uniref:Uncharacterized protein n=1 Tax=Candidatus Falkowbacteria bacterium RIFOXYC2_FULL_36_12 TaxID=1798002 RepID=A0A1F5T1P0_9BACT|nr:MAG: hypothetical protein A2300_04105 [Candidatus Falkowbacteria bacterium RIFOXYB2_FULL_35_7]OGF32381.1 MAG: hypothetical protein A2478_03620 [Candidatus Falkowbacteria bacterium RIFOXYC2_FULL_36_12]OGF34735.1 MAG: hypothetical protein A2223_00935 [Candidatus Falkowbacteria bacterium RIFOXYA2_FULL_35_8]OGF48368.1 MAG: hypothetical protein A2533_04450 [Candidatus Falkowbacteria bacterium RIFOXYD2_FULL_35_9]